MHKKLYVMRGITIQVIDQYDRRKTKIRMKKNFFIASGKNKDQNQNIIF